MRYIVVSKRSIASVEMNVNSYLIVSIRLMKVLIKKEPEGKALWYDDSECESLSRNVPLSSVEYE